MQSRLHQKELQHVTKVLIELKCWQTSSHNDLTLKMTTTQVVINHLQQSFWRLLSPRQPHKTSNWYSWVQTICRDDTTDKWIGSDIHNFRVPHSALWEIQCRLKVYMVWPDASQAKLSPSLSNILWRKMLVSASGVHSMNIQFILPKLQRNWFLAFIVLQHSPQK